MSSAQILAVVVRYKMQLADSKTIVGLTDALNDSELAREIAVLLWDNSPVPLIDPQLAFTFQYGWTEQNLGTSGAYNQGIALAIELDIPWMLLLDQDTEVTADFLRGLLKYSRALADRPEVGSIVPFISSHGQIVSPRRFRSLNRNSPVERTFQGLLRDDGFAVNSASLMRVSALREIRGYSDDFWLDLSDVYAFQRMYGHGRHIFIAGNLELKHSVGGMNFHEDMVPERYESFLAAENAYLQIYRSTFENLVQTLRLLLRALRQWQQYRDKRYATITLRYLWMRLTMRPAMRLQIWREHLRARRSISIAKGASGLPGEVIPQ
ncbi:glycosyltransferase [Terriglobus roseus]|uniref:Glycosyltransferase, GT2 family n=1 Tax=Terriglobus roseus TaxID=392734 RepID=A0A1H4NG39_9BACT|nr:glycosyltransferase [Terriglobus roseus]SEB94240.1 Glycosyltransferase, GT2 family [Terriglobus roseus]